MNKREWFNSRQTLRVRKVMYSTEYRSKGSYK